MTTPSLQDLQRDPVNEARLLRNWRGVQRRRAARGRKARLVIGGGAVAFAAAAAAVAIVWSSLGAEPEPLTLADGGVFDRVDGVVVLSDGSRITPDESARLEVLESSAQRVVLRLASGRALFEVTPGGPRRWVVEAGARVEVVGTVFTIDRAPPRVDVEVERGVVLVFADELTDGVRRLAAGERVRVGSGVGSGSGSGAGSGSGVRDRIRVGRRRGDRG